MTRADQSIADAVFGYWNRQVIEWNHPHGVPAKTVNRSKPAPAPAPGREDEQRQPDANVKEPQP